MAKLTGQIVSISESGNLVSDIQVGDLEPVPRDESVSIQCGGHTTVGIYPADHDQPEMTFIAIEGVGGCVELSLVGDDASRFLGINSGDEITIQW